MSNVCTLSIQGATSLLMLRILQTFHGTTVRFFAESVREGIPQSIASVIHIIRQESNVTKSLSTLFIPIVVLEFVIEFCSVIVRELQHGLELILDWNCLVDITTAQKVETERVKVTFVEQFHAHAAVKGQGLVRIFDSQHGLGKVHFIGNVAGRCTALDNFHPVPIRIFAKRQALEW